MKVSVDQDLCEGCQNCVILCPEVFEMKDNKSHPIVEVVPPELEDKCREAAGACPTSAIIIEE
jgi:ferredoxin